MRDLVGGFIRALSDWQRMCVRCCDGMKKLVPASRSLRSKFYLSVMVSIGHAVTHETPTMCTYITGVTCSVCDLSGSENSCSGCSVVLCRCIHATT